MDLSEDPVTSDVLFALQLRTANEPFLPRLKIFKCEDVTEAFIPFIPFFLSHKTVEIDVGFANDSPVVMVASMVARLSTLRPDLEYITLNLPRDPVITEAVSEMLLACNRDILQRFLVTSPLTEEARGVLYQLPRLRWLWAVIQGPILLPPVILPSLTSMYLEYDHGHNWLRGFSGGTLGELKSVIFRDSTGLAQITNFLEEFQNVALTTTATNTLSRFRFRTFQRWNPNYSSLLAFGQLTELEIEFSCSVDCSSTLDDDIIISLAGAMPKLETLRLGKAPCRIPTGVTLKGLVALACRCLQLHKLCIHFQAHTLAEAATSTEPPPPSKHRPAVIPRTGCALTYLQVGEAPIPRQAALAVALALLQVFPQILNVEYVDPQWKNVVETIEFFRRIGDHIHHASKTHLFIHLR